MTLDWCIFSSMLLQQRVISVLSYYLTSLVNLAFYSLLRRCLFPFIHSATHFSYVFLHHSRKREPSMSEYMFWILASSFHSCSIAAYFAAPKCYLFSFQVFLTWFHFDYFQLLHLFCCLRRMSDLGVSTGTLVSPFLTILQHKGSAFSIWNVV